MCMAYPLPSRSFKNHWLFPPLSYLFLSAMETRGLPFQPNAQMKVSDGAAANIVEMGVAGTYVCLSHWGVRDCLLPHRRCLM